MPASLTKTAAALVSACAMLLLLVPGSSSAAPSPRQTPCGEDCQRAAAAAALNATANDGVLTGSVELDETPDGPIIQLTSNRDDPGTAPGDGLGEDERCFWRPIGPVAEIQAAQAAVNAQQTPTVNPNMPGVEVMVPEMVTPVGGQTTWFELNGTSARVRADEVCDGRAVRRDWVTLVPDGSGNLVIQISAEDLVPGAYDRVVRQLPTPIPRVGPADEDEDGYAFVNNRTFFWLDRAAGQWNPVTATASAGGVSVTVQAQPVRLVVDPGDGTDPVRCDSFVPVLRDDVRTNGLPGNEACSYTYTDSSAMAPNGETWPVTTSIVWHVTWTANTGQAGDLGYTSTASPPRDLPVAEIQAVITETVDGT